MNTVPQGITLVILIGYELLSLELVASHLVQGLRSATLIDVRALVDRQGLTDSIENRKKVFEQRVKEVMNEGIEFFIVLGFPADTDTAIEARRLFNGRVIAFNSSSSARAISARKPMSRERRDQIQREIDQHDAQIREVRKHLEEHAMGYYEMVPSRIESVQAQFIKGDIWKTLDPASKTLATS
jgi:hypothetical protein